MFKQTIIEWVEENWEEIRSSVPEYTMLQFMDYIDNMMMSLGGLNLVIDMCLTINIICTIMLMGYSNVMMLLFPLSNY